ncbi:MAG: RraA family protein [Acidobacteriaceae bacterium]
MGWQNDSELLCLIKEKLYTPVVGDILDNLGFWHQFLPQSIKPMRAEMRIAGRAMTVQLADVTGPQKQQFGRLTEALDQIQADEIYIATGGTRNCAAWGEILTATARTRRGVGAIIDGFHRDTPRILEQEWPVFSRGSYSQDAGVRSSVIDFRCLIEIQGVRIKPGDLIFGDMDGVVIIPRDIEEKVVSLALQKASAERVVRREIEAGAASTDVFHKYGIL